MDAAENEDTILDTHKKNTIKKKTEDKQTENKSKKEIESHKVVGKCHTK